MLKKKCFLTIFLNIQFSEKAIIEHWLLEQWKELKDFFFSVVSMLEKQYFFLSSNLLEKSNNLQKQRLVLAGLCDATVLINIS